MLLGLSCWFALLGLAGGEDVFPPKVFQVERYQAIVDRNPFGEMKLVSGPTEERVERQLVLRGLVRIDRRWIAHVEESPRSKHDKKVHYRLEQGVWVSGLRLTRVKPHRDPARSWVLLEVADQLFPTIVSYPARKVLE